MSTIQQVDQLIEVAEKMGYRVRYDYFGGTGGGACEFSNQKWIFMDLALTSIEQLEHLQRVLEKDPTYSSAPSVNRAA